MKTLQLYAITLLTVLFTSAHLQGQDHNDQIIVQQIYDVLQNKNSTSKEISALKAGINWSEAKSEKTVNNRHYIRFSALMKNEWESLLFQDLEFQIPEKDKVVVTGTVNGRQRTECEYISTPFKHYWSLKNGKIVGFIE